MMGQGHIWYKVVNGIIIMSGECVHCREYVCAQDVRRHLAQPKLLDAALVRG